MAQPDLAVNTVVLVQLIGNVNGQRIINTFHYRTDTSPAPATSYRLFLDKLFLKLNAANEIIQKYQACMTVDYTLERVRIQPVYPTRQRYVDYPLTISGTFSGGTYLTVAQNLAASIKRVTNFIGASGVGRVQMVMPNGQASGGFIVDVNGYKTALDDFGATFLHQYLTASPVANWIPCLFGAGYVPSGVYDLVDGEVENTVRTMHRRTTFLGE